MVNKRTDQFTAIGATAADGDLIFITDVSDTTDRAEGTSKKVTRANLNQSEAEIIAKLDGATIPAITVATGDKVVLQDVDDSDNLGTATAAAIAALGGGTPADNAVGLAQLTHGTDGELYTFDAAGAPAFVATGTSGQFLTSNGAGTAPTFQTSSGSAPLIGDLPIGTKGQQYTVDEAESAMEYVLASKYVSTRKGSAGTIAVCTPVYVSGWNAGNAVVEVEEADADDSSLMPAVGLSFDSLTNAADGRVLISGVFDGCDTSSWTTQDRLYVSATVGTLTNVKPTGTSAIQAIATVLRSHASAGVLLIHGAGRSNDVPNIASANFWLGDATAVATAVTMSGHATMDNAGAVTIADNAVDLAQMAHGTDGELITYDAAGAPAKVAVGTAAEVLTSNGVGAAPTFQAAAGGPATSSQAGAPGSTPATVNDLNVDTTGDVAYTAVGTASSDDWVISAKKEVTFSVSIQGQSGSTVTRNAQCFPIAGEVTGIAYAMGRATSSDASNFWTIMVQNRGNGNADMLAAAHNTNTGAEMSLTVAVDLGAVHATTANMVVAAGDIPQVVWTETGTATSDFANVGNSVLFTIKPS